jgi:acyl dehydratase
VPDISLNAVANLGYAEGRFLAPVHPGDTLSSAKSEVIGLKENSNGKTGVVYVRTTGVNQRGVAVLSYVRWVMVRKRDPGAVVEGQSVPQLATAVAAADLKPPPGLDFKGYDFAHAGAPHAFEDYAVGEKIDHVDGMVVEEAEAQMATRLWQNTAKVHFNQFERGKDPSGRRLVYGGVVISTAKALSFNGLQNAGLILAINGGRHVSPYFAGGTVFAWSEVLDKAELSPTSARCACAWWRRWTGPAPTSPTKTRPEPMRPASSSTSTIGRRFRNVAEFILDPAFVATSAALGELPLCHARLQLDARYPWVVLIPRIGGMRGAGGPDGRRPGAADGGDGAGRRRRPGRVRRAGPSDRQAQCRRPGQCHPPAACPRPGPPGGDPAWPGPVWGHSPAEAYPPDRLTAAIAAKRTPGPGRLKRHPAVNGHAGAGDETGFLADQIGDQASHLAGLAHAGQRDQRRDHLGQAVGHVGQGGAGLDVVDGDPARGQVDRRALDQGRHGRLGHGVGAAARKADADRRHCCRW